MSPSRLLSIVLWAAVAYTVAVLLLGAQQLLAPQRNGTLALGQILAPHMTMLAAVLVPLALVRTDATTDRPRRVLRTGLLGVLVIGALRFGPGLVSLPATPPPDAGGLTVMSWNLEATGSGVRDLHEMLLASSADVVGLQELTRSAAAALEGDPAIVARFPSMVLDPDDGSTGIGLLARHPFLDSGWLEDPSAAWALIDMGPGRDVLAVTAHPLPARLDVVTSMRVPIWLDATERDEALLRLRREFVDGAVQDRDPVVLFGDFNVSDREPGYRDLTRDLSDAHAQVGLGPGSTWRPARLEWLPFGLLRIDYVFTGGAASPLWIESDCTPRQSDHCILTAGIALEP